MGIIRKTLSVASFAAGVPVVQFRSDTERVAYQVKRLRQDLNRQASEIHGQVEYVPLVGEFDAAYAATEESKHASATFVNSVLGRCSVVGTPF